MILVVCEDSTMWLVYDIKNKNDFSACDLRPNIGTFIICIEITSPQRIEIRATHLSSPLEITTTHSLSLLEITTTRSSRS